MATLPERAQRWLAAQLAPPGPPGSVPSQRVRVLLACAAIFFVAVGARLLYWQDRHLELSTYDTLHRNMARQYRREALRMLNGGGILFPDEPVDPGDALLLLHPPGYAMLMATSFKFFGESDVPIRWLQILCDAAAAVLTLLIACELLPFAVALLAALMAAVSPQLGYYSLQLSPDSLAALPILAAIIFLIRAMKRPQLWRICAAGAMLGVSCWLRSNSLLLAPFLALALCACVERSRRWQYPAVFVGIVLVTMAPLIIRNRLLFSQSSPLPVPGGLNLVQGIAEMDREGRFGLPRTDVDALWKDVEWHNRPDYVRNLWVPDGIERDRYRAERGFQVIRENPGWFAGVMLRRAAFMLHYNDARPRDWPFSTSTVPPIGAQAAFSHSLAPDPEASPRWSPSPPSLFDQGGRLAPRATATVTNDGSLKITGDDSPYGDQLTTAAVSVNKNTDYVIVLAARPEQGNFALKVTDGAGLQTLATAVIARPPPADTRRRPDQGDNSDNEEDLLTRIAFASGPHEQVRVALMNNDAPAVAQVRQIALFEMGPTRYTATRWPRLLLRAVQKNLYTTGRLLPLVLIGIGLLGCGGRGRALLLLLTVPIYYLLTHSPFSTEYRYILAMHFFFFILAATTLLVLGRTVRALAQRGRTLLRRKARTSAAVGLTE